MFPRNVMKNMKKFDLTLVFIEEKRHSRPTDRSYLWNKSLTETFTFCVVKSAYQRSKKPIKIKLIKLNCTNAQIMQMQVNMCT